MGDGEEDPYGYMMEDCRYSSSQEEILSQVQFAREGEDNKEEEESKVKVLESSARKLEDVDGDSEAEKKKTTTTTNLGFGGGERQLMEGCGCTSKEEEEEERVVKEPELKKFKVSATDEPQLEAVLQESESKSESSINKNVELEFWRGPKKRELPPSWFGGGLLPTKPNKDKNHTGNVQATVTVTVDGNGNKRDCNSTDETNKCILDGFTFLLNYVTHPTAHPCGGGGAKVDILGTATRCGIMFPPSRFLSQD